jgi:hypothetical protein
VLPHFVEGNRDIIGKGQPMVGPFTDNICGPLVKPYDSVSWLVNINIAGLSPAIIYNIYQP